MSLLIKLLTGFIFAFFFTFSCKQESKRNQEDASIKEGEKIKSQSIVINTPSENSSSEVGKEILINYSFKDSIKVADSVVLRINGKRTSKNNYTNRTFSWETQNVLPGIKNLTITAYYPDSIIENKHIKISMVSDLKPELYNYKVINTYPHDINAYTQGLLFEDGSLFEGTGQNGMSTLRKVKLETGERLKVLNLPPDIFGEGLASSGKYLYQLTYKNNIAFQYDKNTFELVNKYNFPMNEGWGLTYDGKYLLMTDGTENIYFLDPEYFTEVKRIEVYDNNGPVYKLNELEYIKNEIWANVYTTDTIVRIDPSTGKVTGKTVITDILKPEDYHPNIDYLNGIAYDKEKDRVFITGKNWPKLFEIKLIKR